MHILMTSQYFPPETGALASRAGDHVRRWVAAGARVTVLSGTPNYPSGEVPCVYRGRGLVEERWHGARVLRVPVLSGRNERAAVRAGSYLSYALSAVVVGALKGARPDVVLGSTPPPTAALAGAILAARFGAPFVLEERDPWPESLVALGAPRPPGAVVALRALMGALRRRARRVVVATPEMAAALADRGFDASRLRCVPNGVERDLFHPAAPAAPLRADLGIADGALVGHVGSLGHGQDLVTLVDALSLLPPELKLRVVLAGDGVRRDELIRRAARQAPGRLRFLPPRPRDEVPGLLRALDVVLVSSRWSPACDVTVPAKLYEALAVGRPVLLAGRGAAARLLRQAGAGRLVAPGDARALAAALAELARGELAGFGAPEKGVAFVHRHHDRATLAAEMLSILREVRHGD